MRYTGQVIAIGTVSVVQLAPQLAALLLLPVQEFGAFSLVYLVYALAASVLLSCVSEAQARSGQGALVERGYVASATWLSIPFGVLAGVILLLSTDKVEHVVAGIVAVISASRRSPLRYNELGRGRWRCVLRADGLAGLSFLLVIGVLVNVASPVSAVYFAWAVSGVIAWTFGAMPGWGSPGDVRSWFFEKKDAIRPLLRESVILDLSSIGGPYILAPLLGVVQFGIYRAVSNLGAPVRLALNLVRPRLTLAGGQQSLSLTRKLWAVAAAVGVGTAGALALLWISQRPIGIDVLDALAVYWLPTGLFLSGAVLSHYFYIAARMHGSASGLWRGRMVQSFSALVLPIMGAGLWGLVGAIWLFSVATLLGAWIWHRVLKAV